MPTTVTARNPYDANSSRIISPVTAGPGRRRRPAQTHGRPLSYPDGFDPDAKWLPNCFVASLRSGVSPLGKSTRSDFSDDRLYAPADLKGVPEGFGSALLSSDNLECL